MPTAHHNPATDRAAVIHGDLVVFGHMHGDEFVPSHSTPSRACRTRAGAERAARKWVSS